MGTLRRKGPLTGDQEVDDGGGVSATLTAVAVWPAALYAALVFVVAALILTLSWLLGERQYHGSDAERYESGIKPAGPLPQPALGRVLPGRPLLRDLRPGGRVHLLVGGLRAEARLARLPGTARVRPAAVRRARVSLAGRRARLGRRRPAPPGDAGDGQGEAGRAAVRPRRRRRRPGRAESAPAAGGPAGGAR